MLASVLARAAPGLRLNEHLEADGPDVFHHACMLGLEGIVSKRNDSQYRSGRSPHWIKSKNPNAPAVRREPEEHILGSVTVDAGVCEPKGVHQLR
jgi:bifunctional non-homologous end joining protein LigD